LQEAGDNERHDTNVSFAQLLALIFPCETFFTEMK
jgi:hypothetical protein